MAKRAGFDVLVGTDGSPQGRAAVAATVGFPWPRGARAHGVVARGGFVISQATAEWTTEVWTALGRSLERIRRTAGRVLARRWPDVEVVLVDEAAVPGILARARRVGAEAIVVGSRGHGALGRLVLGSVSRGVVRRAACPVLVVKGRPKVAARHLLVGLDGSAHARRAVALVARLVPPRGGRVTVLQVVEPVRAPAMALVPASIQAAIAGEAARATGERRRAAERTAEAAARAIRRAGWRARPLVRLGVPVTELLAAVKDTGADTLVLGARGVGGVERLLLGSVAEGALNGAAVPVLVVK